MRAPASAHVRTSEGWRSGGMSRSGIVAYAPQRPSTEPTQGMASEVFVNGLQLTVGHLAVHGPRHDLEERRVLRVPVLEVRSLMHDLDELFERQPRGPSIRGTRREVARDERRRQEGRSAREVTAPR